MKMYTGGKLYCSSTQVHYNVLTISFFCQKDLGWTLSFSASCVEVECLSDFGMSLLSVLWFPFTLPEYAQFDCPREAKSRGRVVLVGMSASKNQNNSTTQK